MKRESPKKIWLYGQALKTISLFFPFRLEDTLPSRNSASFKIYTKVLLGYITFLKKLDQENQNFRKELLINQLNTLLAEARKSVWWGKYLSNYNVKKISSIEDFRKIPPTSRKQLLYIPKEHFLTESIKENYILWRSSGGSSTGTPFIWGHNKKVFYVTVISRFLKEMIGLGFNFKNNAKKGFYIQFNFPHRPHASPFFWFMDYDFKISTKHPNYRDEIKKMVNKINEIDGCVLRVSPIELGFLLRELGEADLTPSIQFCLVVGGFLEPDLRIRAENYLKCPVIVHYGTQEAGPFSLECRENQGMYHVFSERVFVEITDQNNMVLPEGEVGEITVTTLDNFLMPLIRYKVGDYGILHTSIACNCNNKTPLIEVIGRETDYIYSTKTKYSARPLLAKLNQEPYLSKYRRFQLQQHGHGSIVITFESENQLSDEQLKDLHSYCAKYYPEISTTIEYTHHIPQETPKFKVFAPIRK